MPGPEPSIEPPRQRWRVVFGRGADAPPATQAELTRAWAAGLARSGLPFVGAVEPKVTFAAPLPVGMPADRELLEFALRALHPAHQVRMAVEAALPPGHRLVDVHDVWLGEASLPGQLTLAAYDVSLDPAVDRAAITAAVIAVLQATSLPRARDKGGRSVSYDLRPLIESIEVAPAERPVVLRILTRFDAERGAGRPDEVIAAVMDRVIPGAKPRGAATPAASIVRRRLVLRGEH
jgi:hypothetical protein